jgi:hypothetical protein
MKFAELPTGARFVFVTPHTERAVFRKDSATT